MDSRVCHAYRSTAKAKWKAKKGEWLPEEPSEEAEEEIQVSSRFASPTHLIPTSSSSLLFPPATVKVAVTPSIVYAASQAVAVRQDPFLSSSFPSSVSRSRVGERVGAYRES